MDITGNIIAVLPAQSGTSQRTGNSWMRQEYVVEVPGMYPKKMCFSVFGSDRIRQFGLAQGQQNVTIQFDIDAHEHEGKWYNEIRCYNVLRAVPVGQMAQPAQQPFPPSAEPFPPQAPPPEGKKEDLPF